MSETVTGFNLLSLLLFKPMKKKGGGGRHPLILLCRRCSCLGDLSLADNSM